MRILPGLLLVGLLFSVSNVDGRETRPLPLDEKVKASDAVFVGRVLSVSRPSTEVAGVGEYATVRIERVLKGTETPETVLFVTKGFSAELNPLCCAANKTYLFFAKHGVDVFELTDAGASLSLKEEETYFSAVNGPYGAYAVEGGNILGWDSQSAEEKVVSIDHVARLICRSKMPAREEDDAAE